MDLRTRFVFGLVAVSLGSMLAVGTLAYTSAEGLLTTRSELRLSSLAEAKGEQIEEVVEGWQEAVRLISGRTPLLRSVQAWNEGRSEVERRRIMEILEDVRSSGVVEVAAVFDPEGRLIAGAGLGSVPTVDAGGEEVAMELGVVMEGFTEEEPPRVSFSSPLVLDQQRVGTFRAILSTRDLAEVAANLNGLRETGEALIATEDGSGSVRLLTPRRHQPLESGGSDLGADLQALALGGPEGTVVKNLTDYRNEPVWAAKRSIPAAGLLLVVKFDDAEERADVAEYRTRILGAGFSLSAFAILLGVLMGLSFAKPIHELAAVADKIRGGDLTARADESRKDELGVLAETFNEMSGELERRMSLLQEYKTFFDSSRDMLCIASTDGYFKRANPSFERELGWAVQDLLDTPFIDFVHPDDVDASLREVEKLSRGIPTVSFENRWRTPDGSYRRLLWTCHPDPQTGVLYAAARQVRHDDA